MPRSAQFFLRTLVSSVLLAGVIGAQTTTPAQVTVRGSVVARLRGPIDLILLQGFNNFETFIVRESGTDGKTKRYLKVRYEIRDETGPLSDKFLDATKRWQFRLTRDTSCDGSIEDYQGTKSAQADPNFGPAIKIPLVKMKGAEAEVISETLVLPCYLLPPNSIKPIGRSQIFATGH
jgi:hypothetical protein